MGKRSEELKALEIDQYRLDDEWNNQPQVYARYALKAADARRSWDESKANLEVVKAELDRDIRKNPEKYDLLKITETQISSTIVLQDDYKVANEEVIRTHHDMDVVNAFVQALDQRKSALSKLVDLFLADYFSKPKASATARDHVQEVEKRAVRGRVKVRDPDSERE